MKQRIMKHIAAGLMALWMTGLVSGAATNDTFDFEKELALLEAQQDELVADAAGSTNVVVTQAAKSEEALVVPEMGTDRSFNMWRSVGSLLIIVGALFLVSKWMQKRFPSRMGNLTSHRMKIQERLTIDHRRQLVLVSVDDRELVIAMGPNQMESVAQWKSNKAAALPMDGDVQ